MSHTDRAPGKVRPVLVLKKLPGIYDDWLICMISTNLSQAIEDFDEVITDTDEEFKTTGLKRSSVLRISRLATVDGAAFLGFVGKLGEERLDRIKRRLSQWLEPSSETPRLAVAPSPSAN